MSALQHDGCHRQLRSAAVNMTGQRCFARSLRLVIMMTLIMVLLSACVPEHSKIMTYHGTRLSKIGWIPYPHNGVDFEDKRGAPVLAVADGVVISFWTREETRYTTESLGIVIYHPEYRLYSTYGHLLSANVTKGMEVKRGQVIAANGTGGLRKNRIPGSMPAHVHLELQLQSKGQGCTEEKYNRSCTGESVDPLTYDGGCFDPDKEYPEERFVLTYPVRC